MPGKTAPSDAKPQQKQTPLPSDGGPPLPEEDEYCTQLKPNEVMDLHTEYRCLGPRQDCWGVAGAATSYWVLFHSQYTMTNFIIKPWMGESWLGWVHILILNLNYVLIGWSHWMAMTTAPGFNGKGVISQEDFTGSSLSQNSRYCKTCRNVKNRFVHHCSLCRRCVRHMDHHCPWVNNCVGERNQKFFVLFVFYTCTGTIYHLTLIIWKFVTTRSAMSWLADGQQCTTFCVVMTVIEVVILVLFGIFTGCLTSEQVEAIWDNTTTVKFRGASLAHHVLNLTKEQQGFRRVFGKTFSMWWFLPVHPDLEESPAQCYILTVYEKAIREAEDQRDVEKKEDEIAAKAKGGK